MNDTSPQILILGGGTAGMSAALALKDQNVAVHLVEISDHLGGNAAQWACMATTTCQNCGACLVQEMAHTLMSQANVHIYTDTQLTRLTRQNGAMTAELSGGQTLTPARIIMATGFTPFDPAGIPSYHTDATEKVITTAQLNTLIREERLEALTGPAPRIAFLQCVGSRDRKEGRDYCSQVCCKISMRHAQKLNHLLPGARVSLFYMDLQVIGKEARTAAETLEHTVELIQGVPAEILENPETGRLTMVTEDPATLTRVSREFDLIVLSVGMVPHAGTVRTSELTGITPNAWGFFNTEEAILNEALIVAGCARGPKDILGSRQEGLIAAARAFQSLDHSPGPQALPAVAVIGSGDPALAAASAAADLGYPAVSFGSPGLLPRTIQDLSGARILAINGATGNFSVFYETGGKKAELTCGAIIASPVPDNPDRAAGLPGAMSLSEFAQTDAGKRPGTSLILLDYFGPENKAFSRQALTEAVKTREAGKTVFVLMHKMLVHGPEGQLAYDKARKAGVKFLRFEKPEDLDIQPGGDGVTITLPEATLPGRTISLTADCLVVPPALIPTPSFGETADLLKVDLDREGFLQAPNVRHRLVQSPRKGIFFAGPCHDETDSQDLAAELSAIMAEMELRRRAVPTPDAAPVTINEKKCAKCLTCYRVCPHGAIILNEKSRPQIIPEACFSCQACVSNCPAYAIEADGFDNDAIAARAVPGRTMVLACERSGALAAEKLPSDADLVTIPCACRISSDMLMKALINGADRVIVSGCHEGNCRSAQGSATARGQVEKVAAMPGVPQGKLRFQTAAANEPKAFARLVAKGGMSRKG